MGFEGLREKSGNWDGDGKEMLNSNELKRSGVNRNLPQISDGGNNRRFRYAEMGIVGIGSRVARIYPKQQ